METFEDRTCRRCGKAFSYPSRLREHLARKTLCAPAVLAVSVPRAVKSALAATGAAGPEDTRTLAGELAQWALTQRLRHILSAEATGTGAGGGRAHRETSAVLERWLVAQANALPSSGDPAWATIYRTPQPTAPYNVKLTAELVETRIARAPEAARRVVSKLLGTVERALVQPLAPSPPVSRRDDGVLLCGEFRSPDSARFRKLVELCGEVAALRVAVRYAALGSGGQQWAVPQAHADYLREHWGVRGEAFASPLNARFLGVKGARFCSLFPDVDGPFGSVGSFFEADLGPAGFGWLVNPPFVEALLLRAALRVVEALETLGALERTVFFVTPAWDDCEAVRVLRASRALRAERRLRPPHYFFEDPQGGRVPTRVNTLYFALSTSSRPGLAEALAEWGVRD